MRVRPRQSRAVAMREVLVAISVIILTAVVGVGSWMHVRENARATACLAILERYGVAFAQYAQASGGFLPYENVGREQLGYVAWRDVLSDHLGDEDRICPSVDRATLHYEECYRMNSKLSRTRETPPRPFRALDTLARPAVTVLLFEAGYGGAKLSLKGGLKDRDARHRGALNVLFADWHVERMQEQRLVEMSNWLPPKIIWDPQPTEPVKAVKP